jgi:hypothetical protein
MPLSTEPLLGKITGHAIALRKNINDNFEYRMRQINFYRKIVNKRNKICKQNIHKTLVKEAVLVAYNELPIGNFLGNSFCRRVNQILGRQAYQDTILHELRNYRSAGVVNFENVSQKKKSLYNKLED